MQRGKFITLEGGEGTGKTTQIAKMAGALKAQGIDVITTREPGGTPEAEKLRNLVVQRDGGDWDYITEAMLFAAARREHLVKKIWPALSEGKWVISDRFLDSTRVYQGYAHGVDKSLIEGLYYMIAEDFEPDLTFILDIDPVTGLERSRAQLLSSHNAKENTEDRFERIGLDFHQKLREGYLKIAEQDSKRCVVIDAGQTVAEIHRQMMDVLVIKCQLQKKGCQNGAV